MGIRLRRGTHMTPVPALTTGVGLAPCGFRRLSTSLTTKPVRFPWRESLDVLADDPCNLTQCPQACPYPSPNHSGS
jgi:hypothetical protein